MSNKELVQAEIKRIEDGLSAPFHESIVKWIPKVFSKAQKGIEKDIEILGYIDARDVMSRLDEVVGPNNWTSKHTVTDAGVYTCELSIRMPWYNPFMDSVEYEWVCKSDGADETKIEAAKGGHSDSLKRAAVNFGVGRYLYMLGDVTVKAMYTGSEWKYKRPVLPDFARPSKYTDNEQMIVAKMKQAEGESSAVEEVAIDESVTKSFTKDEILETMAPDIPEAFHGKTIGEVVRVFGDSSLHYLAGYIQSKNGTIFVPADDVERDIQMKAKVYLKFYLTE